MRLVCPNCDAEYEVDDAAIPRSGRDVQCSNCGHAWFQVHPEVTAAAEEEAALFGAEAAPEPPAPAPAFPEAEPAPPEPEEVLAAETLAELPPMDAPAPEPLPVPELPRRSIDESVLAVLREEAEREAAARRGERPALETQVELPLTEAPVRSAALEDPVDPTPGPVTPEAPSKRALLPEIEEIKSSLHPTPDPEDEATQVVPARDGGFRTGFVFSVLIAVILLAVYVMAPVIAAKVPALTGALTAYVKLVNGLRVMLDHQVRALIGWLQGLAGGSAG